MKLLHEIQASLLNENASVGSALLKLRFLADRLGSENLEDWVRHEVEGYRDDTPVPAYRKVGIIYSGTFTNGYRVLNDIPIPSHTVRSVAGDGYINYQLRDGMAVVDEAVRKSTEKDGGTYQINCGNLMPLLTDKLFQDYTCISVRGVFDAGAYIRVQSSVRAKALDLCLKIERELPKAAEIEIGPSTKHLSQAESAQVAQIFNQTFNGPYTAITATGSAATIRLQVNVGDQTALQRALSSEGMLEIEAVELAEIVANEIPESKDEPFGPKAKQWILAKAQEGAAGLWKMGLDVAKDVIKQYLKQYYFGG